MWWFWVVDISCVLSLYVMFINNYRSFVLPQCTLQKVDRHRYRGPLRISQIGLPKDLSMYGVGNVLRLQPDVRSSNFPSKRPNKNSLFGLSERLIHVYYWQKYVYYIILLFVPMTAKIANVWKLQSNENHPTCHHFCKPFTCLLSVYIYIYVLYIYMYIYI